MNLPNPVDQAIAQCDRILENIERIQRDMRAATEAAQAALQDCINKCREYSK